MGEVPPYRFFGTYEHSLDDKGRLTIPSSFRDDFKAGAVLRKDREGCIDVLPLAAWNLYVEKLGRIPKSDALAQRWVALELASAVSVNLDKQGRVLLPADMRVHAGLEGGKVVVTGALDRIKVWSTSRWEELQAQAETEDLDAYIYEKYEI